MEGTYPAFILNMWSVDILNIPHNCTYKQSYGIIIFVLYVLFFKTIFFSTRVTLNAEFCTESGKYWLIKCDNDRTYNGSGLHDGLTQVGKKSGNVLRSNVVHAM